MGLWNTIKKAARSVGKFVKKNWKAIVGVAAAVIIPFAAPAIAGIIGGSAFLASTAVGGFLQSAAGAALVGAGLGAGAAGITGQNPLLGAALGGIGAFGVAGGMSSLFGGIGSTAAGPVNALGGMGSATTTAAAGAAPAAGGLLNIGGVTATAGGIPIGAASIGSAAAGSLSGTIGTLATKLATNPQSLGALSQLALTMFNKDMNELTPEEKAQLEEVASQAATNRALFEQKVMEANRLINMGTANPEQAYATARYAADTQLQNYQRGLPAGLQENAARKAAIASTQAGLQNVAQDYALAADIRSKGVNMLPDRAPTGYNQLAMETYADREARRQKYAEQQNEAVGNLFGSLA